MMEPIRYLLKGRAGWAFCLRTSNLNTIMAAIRRGQKTFNGIDYLGNFLGEPIELGNIYRCDDRSFVLLANITDLVPDLSLKELTVEGKKQNLTFTKESSVAVKIGASADATVGKGEIELNFSKKNSAFVSLKEVTVSQLKLQLLEEKIKEVWSKKKYKTDGSTIMVNQVLAAKSGTVIFSEERNNKVILKGSADEKLTSVVKAASGNVEFVTNSKATLEIISPEPILPMFKAFFYNRKGAIEVVG